MDKENSTYVKHCTSNGIPDIELRKINDVNKLDNNKLMQIQLDFLTNMRNASNAIVMQIFYEKIDKCNVELLACRRELDLLQGNLKTNSSMCYLCPYPDCKTTKFWKTQKTWDNHVTTAHSDCSARLRPAIFIIHYDKFGGELEGDYMSGIHENQTSSKYNCSPPGSPTKNKKRKLFPKLTETNNDNSIYEGEEEEQSEEECQTGVRQQRQQRERDHTGRISILSICNQSDIDTFCNSSYTTNAPEGEDVIRTLKHPNVIHHQKSGEVDKLRRRNELEERIIKLEREKTALDHYKNSLMKDLLKTAAELKSVPEILNDYLSKSYSSRG